jgi:preprotein translocase subunit SecA
MVVQQVGKVFTKVFGSRNDRMIKTYARRVEQINALEPKMRALTDAELRELTQKFRARIESGERMATFIDEVMAAGREAMDRTVGIRNIFNPEAGFDPSVLPSDVRAMVERLSEQMAATEPIEVPGGHEPIAGWRQLDIPNRVYEAVRDWQPQSKPPFRARPFDVQLIGGMVLGEGKIAEMKTGEGKTIVGPLACYVACIEGLQCHVVTVNDYLVQRDRDWVFPFYHGLGLTVGAILPMHKQPSEKKAEAYRCNVVYGTNSEFGFDYLRDNMKLSTAEQVQKQRDFCIIDEVDSILIDEARTPLIISGPAHEDAPRYGMADGVARHLMQKQREWDAAEAKVEQATMRAKGLEGDIRNARDKARIAEMKKEKEQLEAQIPQLEAIRDQHIQYYEVEREKKASHLTHEGVAEAQRVAGIGSFYVGNNMDVPHLLENALRAHVVYQLDKDYVVQNGEVVIVDEFTGRLMIGRQWSDGLHQAVESKERVKIKQETQTLATVTIQNFFKLYGRLAGMTGTAITEGTEFGEIYKLDVVCIPTNVPVIRDDREDLIFLSAKDKWGSILDEIKRMHDIGRPVLVGTTSVEKSEMLAQMLGKRHNIHHEVLNAKVDQAERESNIVAHAGELGAVMIATNMAGRGTDIKLAPIDRANLVRHWQQRNLLPKEAKPDMSDEQLLVLAHRHIATWTLGLKPKDIAEMSDDGVYLDLLRHWAETEALGDPAKIAKMSEDDLLAMLDKYAAGFMLHRLRIFKNIEQMGGLHIIGTERHESRRIDNQLRGRAGRQGDRGSSRFFISLEDDLMKMFAGKTTLTALSKLGMKEGDAIEHKWITKSVERAQRKVEERNYEIRKNLLEYDEVMEHQRNGFYGVRQEVLEGRHVQQIIFDYIGEAIDDAVGTYLDKDYAKTQVAEWCRTTLDVSIDPAKLHLEDADDLRKTIRAQAEAEVRQTVDVTLGEYMADDAPPEDWDLRGLSSWAMSRFSVDLKQNQLRQMNPPQVKEQLGEAAAEQVRRKDLSGVGKFLEPLYGQKDMAAWCRQMFNVDVKAEDFVDVTPEQAADAIIGKARAAYHRREIEYPVDFALDMVVKLAQHDPQIAQQQFAAWVKQRYDFDWSNQDLPEGEDDALRVKLIEQAEQWYDGGRLEELVDQKLAEQRDPQALADWAAQRFGDKLTAEDLADQAKRREVMLAAGRRNLRYELTQLERFVLLQILDTAWKDHLYAMDQLKDSVGLRGYAEKDPRIEYKREGSNQFNEMRRTVRDRVTELIFRARLSSEVKQRSVYGEGQARHTQASGALAAASVPQGSEEQRADLAAAEQAGSHGADSHLSRKQRRARAATGAAPGRKPATKQRKRKRR